VLVRDRPVSINLFEAESRSHQVAQLPAVRISASASNESKCKTKVIAGRDVQLFKFEIDFTFKLWLPISPALPVRLRTVVGQWGQDVIDDGVFGMTIENFVEPTFARVLRPKLEDFANVFGVLHMTSSLKEQRASNQGPTVYRSVLRSRHVDANHGASRVLTDRRCLPRFRGLMQPRRSPGSAGEAVKV
jgi:hypothetical protein